MWLFFFGNLALFQPLYGAGSQIHIHASDKEIFSLILVLHLAVYLEF